MTASISERQRVAKIVSGGQTGVDRAALDAAMAHGLATGGWCPRGRRAEDGTLSARYLLQETPTSHYPQRTEWNVRDSDASLVLTRGALEGGSCLTAELAQRLGRPCLVMMLGAGADIEPVVEWLRSNRVRTLNVAGPRESSRPGIYVEARQFLAQLLGRIAPALSG